MSEEKDNCGDDYDDGGDSSSNSGGGGSGDVERNEPWAQPLASGIAKRIVLDFLSSSSSPSSSSSHVNKKGETFDLPIREQIFGKRYPRNRTLQVVRFLS